MKDEPKYGRSPLADAIREFELEELRNRFRRIAISNDMHNERIYEQTKRNYKENGIYEDCENKDKAE